MNCVTVLYPVCRCCNVMMTNFHVCVVMMQAWQAGALQVTDPRVWHADGLSGVAK